VGASAAVSEPPASPSPPRRPGIGPGSLLTLVNGVLAGVGGVFVGTHSVLVTIIAASVAVLLAVLVLVFRRLPNLTSRSRGIKSRPVRLACQLRR
jgi:hypothetical protein